MSPRVVPLALVVVFLVAVVPMASSDPMLARPLAALAVKSGDVALVTWTPAPGGADSYRVYGVRDGSPVPLAVTDGAETSATVPADFPTYEVTAVHAGVESAPTIAAAAVNGGYCVTVDPRPFPPAYAIGDNCADAVKVGVNVLLP